MEIESVSFKNNDVIPRLFTGEGEDISPSLQWSGVPRNCREFVLIVEDPDAPNGTYTHWVAYNISSTTSYLPQGLPAVERLELPVAMDQGKNSFEEIGYGGPMPPRGHGTHHYIFTLYALDAELGLKPGLTKKEVLKAIHGHVITTAQMTGIYERKEEKSERKIA